MSAVNQNRIALLDNEFIKIELENEILVGEWKDSFIDLAVAEKAVNSRLHVLKEKKYPFLVQIKSIKNSTKEARDFLASEKGCEGLIAGAILVDSVFENMIASLFIFLNRPLIPTRVFNDETKAREWLKQFVAES